MEVSAFDQNTLLTWCDNLHQVKSNVSQIQATLNSILNKTPSASDYQELMAMLDKVPESTVVERARALLGTSQVKVGVRLKQLYDSGQLPLWTALAKINFKSPKTDKYVGYLIDYTPGEIVSVLKDEVPVAAVPESYPPVLPPISSDSLLIRVLTDKSYRQAGDFLESANFSRAHNAKLAVKGRALVESLLMDLLDEAYSHIDEDEIYVLCHRVSSPEILSKFALGYNLIDNYKYNLSNELSLSQKLAVFANVFLAYVAGLAEDSYSSGEIKTWLRRLYAPVLADLAVSEPPRVVADVASRQLDLLFKQVTSIHNVRPDQLMVEFVQLESDPFVAQLQINGRAYSLGTSSTSFEDAREKAAAALFEDTAKVNAMMETLVQGYQGTIRTPDTAAPSVPTGPAGATPAAPAAAASVQMTADMYQDHGAGPKAASTGAPAAPHPQPPTGPSSHHHSHNHHHQHQPQPQPYAAPQPYGQPGVTPYGLLPDPSFRTGLDNNAKNSLYALLGQKRMAPVYKYHRAGNEFQATVSVGDSVLGVGYDINKRLASQKAAMNALSNESVLAGLGAPAPDSETPQGTAAGPS